MRLTFVFLFFWCLPLSTFAQDASLEGTWQVKDYKLKKKVKEKDKLAFMMGMAKQMSFTFRGTNELSISAPLLSKPTLYTWKYQDAKKTIIEAIEKDPLFADSPSKWTLKIVKRSSTEIHFQDLGKDKKGNIWITQKE